MPPGIGELTSLHKLGLFKVDNQQHPPDLRCKPTTAQLRDLKNLNCLRGYLQIIRYRELKDPAFEAKEANLSSKHGLAELRIGMTSQDDEAVLEGLKPHPNLKKLEIVVYRVRKLPSWAVMDNLCIYLPNLVEILLMCFGKSRQLPSFGQLPLLKRLYLFYLNSVEYMENSLCPCPYELPFSSEGTSLFFPSLEALKLQNNA